jgi:hypothetical protein
MEGEFLGAVTAHHIYNSIMPFKIAQIFCYWERFTSQIYLYLFYFRNMGIEKANLALTVKHRHLVSLHQNV